MTRQESESDSEASDGQSPTSSARFRVRVNMERFFDDERALAYVCVRAQRRVRWLQRRLAARFRLPPRLLLLSRGHLLPPAEPLAVLRPDDPVDVLPCPPRLDDAPTPPPENPRIATLEPHADVLHTAVGNFVPSAEAPPPNVEDELSARKLRALRMLEQYCDERIESRDVERSASKPRRRRVRRRRRPAPYCADTEAPAAKLDRDDLVPTAQYERDYLLATVEHDALQVSSDSLQAATVLRNGSQKTRIPRVVRALGDD